MHSITPASHTQKEASSVVYKLSFDYFIGTIGILILGSLVLLSLSIAADLRNWYLNGSALICLLCCIYYIRLVTSNKPILIINDTGISYTPSSPLFAKDIQIPWYTIVGYEKYTKDMGDELYYDYLSIITLDKREIKINLSRLEGDSDDIFGTMKAFYKKHRPETGKS